MGVQNRLRVFELWRTAVLERSEQLALKRERRDMSAADKMARHSKCQEAQAQRRQHAELQAERLREAFERRCMSRAEKMQVHAERMQKRRARNEARHLQRMQLQ